MGNKKLEKTLQKKSSGGAVIILSGVPKPIHFKSLLFDPQYRFNPYCDFISWDKYPTQLWQKLVENDEKTFTPVGIDFLLPLNDLDNKELINEFFKKWSNQLAGLIATFYPSGVKLATPYLEVETSNAENPKFGPEVLIKIVIRNFTAKDYFTLGDFLKPVLEPLNAKITKLPEPQLYFDDIKGFLNGTGKFKETEWNHCFHIVEALAGVKDIYSEENFQSLKEIRERFWHNPFRVWLEEARLGWSIPNYYKTKDDDIDFDELFEPSPKPVVNCPKCGKLISVSSYDLERKAEILTQKIERATLSELRRHLIGFKPEETITLPCGHSKPIDATTAKEIIWDGKTYCPHCKRWITIPESWQLPPKLAKLKEDWNYKRLTIIPEKVKQEVYKAECGCYLTPEEWNKLIEQIKRLTCPKCLMSYPFKEISFKDGHILFPCGHTASYEEVVSINKKDFVDKLIENSLGIFKYWDILEVEAVLSKGPHTIREYFNKVLNSFEIILFAKNFIFKKFGNVFEDKTLEDKYLKELLDLPFHYETIENIELFLANIVKYHADNLPDIAPKAKELLFKLNPTFDLDKVINHAIDEDLLLQNDFPFKDNDF